jgi:hypothetical protein
MSNFISEEVGLLSKFVERFPQIGIATSFAGFGASLLAILKVITIIFGAAGAVLGCVAGYYTLRVWQRKWKRTIQEDATRCVGCGNESCKYLRFSTSPDNKNFCAWGREQTCPNWKPSA